MNLTKNQKIAVASITITSFLSLAGLVISIISLVNSNDTKENQIIIKQEIDEIKSKIGSFESLSARNTNFGSLNVTCPEGTKGSGLFSDKSIQLTCVPIED